MRAATQPDVDTAGACSFTDDVDLYGDGEQQMDNSIVRDNGIIIRDLTGMELCLGKCKLLVRSGEVTQQRVKTRTSSSRPTWDKRIRSEAVAAGSEARAAAAAAIGRRLFGSQVAMRTVGMGGSPIIRKTQNAGGAKKKKTRTETCPPTDLQ